MTEKLVVIKNVLVEKPYVSIDLIIVALLTHV